MAKYFDESGRLITQSEMDAMPEHSVVYTEDDRKRLVGGFYGYGGHDAWKPSTVAEFESGMPVLDHWGRINEPSAQLPLGIDETGVPQYSDPIGYRGHNLRGLFSPPDTRFRHRPRPIPNGGVPWFFDKMPTPKPRPKPAYPEDVHPGTGLPSWIWKYLEKRKVPPLPKPKPMPEPGGSPWFLNPLPGMPEGIPPRGTYPGGVPKGFQNLPYRPNSAFSGTTTDPLSFASRSMVPSPRIPTAQEQVRGAVSLPDERAKSFSRLHRLWANGHPFFSLSGTGGHHPDDTRQGYDTEGVGEPDEYTNMYLAVPDAAKKYAYDNPTPEVLNQFEEKYGFPLDISIPLK